jgi:hypothetical protein
MGRKAAGQLTEGIQLDYHGFRITKRISARSTAGSPPVSEPGYIGYLPTPRHFALGGYETWPGTSFLEPEASVLPQGGIERFKLQEAQIGHQ